MRRAFTLIELLVVIAIIALLIGLLLPAIGKARKAGQHVVSDSNMRQICVAAAVYQDSYKGFMPVVPLASTRGQVPESQLQNLTAMASWCYGGKNCNGFWASQPIFDFEAADRPLTPYLTSTPPMPQDMTTTLTQQATDRMNFQVPVCRDPSDQFSYQQQWNATQSPNPNWPQIVSRDWQTNLPISAYDDVGSSYQANFKWWEQLLPQFAGQTNAWQKAWYFGFKRLRYADGFLPSRMCWIHDQYADICVYNPDANFKVRNGYGDINKSIMGFMDGHAAYKPLYPGRQTISYTNDEYTFVFEDLRVPH
jgi:prepilin-type N-terminal cleavage/methylation domain-containing protein